MITERQEKLLNFVVREYISTAEPVSSKALKKTACLAVCGATIRNDLQVLTKEGYIEQPHTSAGRIPTRKAYQYFAQKHKMQSFATAQDEFLAKFMRQIKEAHEEMEHQMGDMQELMQALENNNMFEILTTIEIWHKKNQN